MGEDAKGHDSHQMSSPTPSDWKEQVNSKIILLRCLSLPALGVKKRRKPQQPGGLRTQLFPPHENASLSPTTKESKLSQRLRGAELRLVQSLQAKMALYELQSLPYCTQWRGGCQIHGGAGEQHAVSRVWQGLGIPGAMSETKKSVIWKPIKKGVKT